VAECSGDNLFIYRQGEVQTPDTAAGILSGITRDIVIRLARKRGLTVTEKNLVRQDLQTADECFLTGTAAEIIGVSSIDGRPVGTGKPGEITRMLQKEYEEYRRA
jgi:branched-chain amino acid aminotransferase